MTHVQAICFDLGGTFMSEDGPADRPMALWPEVRTLSGAATTLAALQHIRPLCIATNASMSHRPMIERALARGGLLHYFSHVFCATDLGVGKESPGFWTAVTAALDCAPHHVAMVGDSLEADVFAPQRFGLQAVWFNEGGKQASPAVSVPPSRTCRSWWPCSSQTARREWLDGMTFEARAVASRPPASFMLEYVA